MSEAQEPTGPVPPESPRSASDAPVPFVRSSIGSLVGLTASFAERAKSRGGLAKFSVEWGEYLTRPALDLTQRYGDSVVSQIDEKLNSVYTSKILPILAVTEEKQKSIIDSQWFGRVDAVFQETSSHAKTFYAIAVEQFVHLHQQNPIVHHEQFIANMQQVMGKFWNSQLLEPATIVHAHLVALADVKLAEAKEALSDAKQSLSTKISEAKDSLDAQLARVVEAKHSLDAKVVHSWASFKTMGSQWEDSVSHAFSAQLGAPAQALYVSLMAHYLNLDVQSISAAEFATSVQSTLGGIWNDGLREPVEQFLVAAQAHAKADLRTMHQQLNKVNNTGMSAFLTLVALPRVGIDAVKGKVNDTWNAILQASASTVDYLLPTDTAAPAISPTEAAESSNPQPGTEAKTEGSQEVSGVGALSLQSIGNRVSKRVRARAFTGLNYLRVLSATRAKEIVHVDLIAYAEAVIDQVSHYASPILNQAQSNYSEAADQTKAAFDKTRLQLAQALNSLQISVLESKELFVKSPQVQQVTEFVSPRTQALRAKLQSAIQAAGASRLSQLSSATDLKNLGEDVTVLLGKFTSMLTTTDAKAALAHIQSTLTNLTRLFYWSQLSQFLSGSASSEAQAPTEAKSEMGSEQAPAESEGESSHLEMEVEDFKLQLLEASATLDDEDEKAALVVHDQLEPGELHE